MGQQLQRMCRRHERVRVDHTIAQPHQDEQLMNAEFAAAMLLVLRS
jgi:hypothetical protein